MARTRYIHRTIISTEAEVMTVNTETKEIGSVLVPVSGTFEDKADKKLEKAVRKGLESLNLENTAFVTITDIHPVTKMYRMLESQFMALAESFITDGTEPADDESEE